MLIILIRPKLGHSGIPRMTKVRRPSFSGERYRVIIIRLRSVHIKGISASSPFSVEGRRSSRSDFGISRLFVASATVISSSP